ncbi:MAG: YkgJ family cysteine cluster protein [Thermoguttaceae bacterium]|jgi:hypothetical protein
MSGQLWYQKGLHFKCAECGACCTGEPGYVWLNQEEIAMLAAAIRLDVDEFQRRYVRRVGVRRSLIELANGDCIFFDSHRKLCQVYSARPRQCRTWPFWSSNLATPSDWEAMGRQCPGSGRGPRIPLEKIEARREVVEL